jgi:DNA polymerase III subunit beta
MKLTIERAALLAALGHMQGVVERRNTIPILSNVLIEASGERCTLTATDLDIAVVESVPAKVGKAGATTAPAHTLHDIVRKLPEGADVEIASLPEQRLSLRAGRSNFQLACLPKEDFPAMTAGDFPHRFTLPAEALRRLIDKTRFAISVEETRYYLNGVYLHAAKSDGKRVLRAVATDGHRLARVEAPLPEGAADMPGVIVPRKAVAELRKLLDTASGTVEVTLSPTRIRVACDDVVLVSKLIDGTFPDYERVVPTRNDKRLEVDGKTLKAAVDRVSTIASDKSRAIKLAVAKDRLTLSATSPEHGSASEEIAVAYDAAPMEIGFNSRYLLDIADQIDGDNACFNLADAASPILVRDSSDDSASYVLMPMRV